MTHFVTRTCTKINEGGGQSGTERLPTPEIFEKFRETDAYVLLGAPGAGKTTVFRHEAEHTTGGHYVTARDFITFDSRPELGNMILFIDGLDEIRAGSADGCTPFDNIRTKLDRLNCPRFRLSCREADWFGTSDRSHLEKVSKDGKITVLRLNPLSGNNIHEILRSCHDVPDTDQFIASAREKGVDSLLVNPQSLKMLVHAAKDGTLPETRMQTFDLACRTLLGEHNQEHRIANRDGVDISRLMDAAGRLCAAQLLTGSAGWRTLPDGGSDDEYPGLEQISGEDQAILRHVLGTKLFEAPPEGRATPVHRHVAEFLAARYLAGYIKNGLPLKRVLALMTADHDGGIVSGLRGLSAWLAAHSKFSRDEIIKRDPFGTVLYGDVREFSADEKRRVLNCLAQEVKRRPPRIKELNRNDPRLGDLVTHDMEEHFREILSDPARDDERQFWPLILVEILGHGQAPPGLADLMMETVRDDRRWPRIRGCALSAFIHHQEDHERAVAELKTLLGDVTSGRVLDPQDELLGRLLNELYPEALPPSKILQFLRVPKEPNLLGQYQGFWRWRICRKSTAAQLAEILDDFVARYDRLRAEVQNHPDDNSLLLHAPQAVLSCFLEKVDMKTYEVELERLFNWLGVAAWVDDCGDDQVDDLVGDWKQAEHIAGWLGEHPKLLKSLWAMGVARCMGSSEFSVCIYRLRFRRLFNARLPADFGRWCLDQAVDAEDHDVATYWIREVARCLSQQTLDKELSRELIETRIARHEALAGAFHQRLAKPEDNNAHDRRPQERRKKQMTQCQRQWHKNVKSHETALRENRCPPPILGQLARAYYGGYANVRGDTPGKRLADLIGNDKSLIEAILTGFRGTINRDDLPDDAEIMRLKAQNQVHLLTFPFMAGLEELAHPAPDKVSLNEKQRRLALTIHYLVPIWPLSRDHAGKGPSWFRVLLRSHPEAVSDVLVRVARFQLRSGADFDTGLRELAFSLDHAGIARLAALPLLKTFPVRCTERQLPSLNHLLIAALLHCKEMLTPELIAGKLAHRSMNVSQRIYWMLAGLFISPDPYREKLESYVAKNERRIRRLTEAVAGYDHQPALIQRLNVPALQFLIRLNCIPAFVDQLASIPNQAATEALEALSSDDDLLPQRAWLNEAKYEQNFRRREAEFRYCNIQHLEQVLAGHKPANVAGLATLTIEYLREISSNIRDGNTSDWHQYWNVDPNNRPQAPKPENGCRDALLSNLQSRFSRLGIDAQPEGRHADDNRSDIRVSYDSFNVPVEVKRSCHRDLWSAIGKQLIARYTRDPGAGGYGIYLVFWFGDTEHCRPTSGEGPPLESAAELEERLVNTLSENEKLKIQVCVIDVSKPET